MAENEKLNNVAVDNDVGTMEDVDAIMKKYDRESNTRVWEGTPRKILRVLTALFGIFLLATHGSFSGLALSAGGLFWGLAAAVALLLTPSRMLACLLSRWCPLRDESPAPEELEKKLLPRALLYSGSAAVVYLAAYPILNAVFGTDLLTLGIYLPMLIVEPLLTYRFGRVQETMHKAVSKGLRITLGYALILLLLGCVREWLAYGSVFGVTLSRSILPMASMPAGGFIVLGVLCAVWRALARKQREYLKNEARGYLAVHPKKEAEK